MDMRCKAIDKAFEEMVGDEFRRIKRSYRKLSGFPERLSLSRMME